MYNVDLIFKCNACGSVHFTRSSVIYDHDPRTPPKNRRDLWDGTPWDIGKLIDSLPRRNIHHCGNNEMMFGISELVGIQLLDVG